MIVLLSEISKCLNKKLQIETVSESLTMIGLEVESINEVSLSSLDSAQEETITAMLTIRTNQDNICFIIFIYRKFCKI